MYDITLRKWLKDFYTLNMGYFNVVPQNDFFSLVSRVSSPSDPCLTKYLGWYVVDVRTDGTGVLFVTAARN